MTDHSESPSRTTASGTSRSRRSRARSAATVPVRHADGLLRRTFRSLHTRNYRLYFMTQVISNSGTWMQSFAQAALVLYLAPKSALTLSIVVALQFGPVLVIGPWGGLIADRADKRKLLIATQSVMTLQAATLALLTLTGAVQVWMIMVLATVMGVANGIDNPARQSFVIEMVGPDDVANAVALNSVIVNTSRVVGPAIGGLFVLFARSSLAGLGWCFAANAVSYLFVIAALAAMRVAELQRAQRVSPKRGQLRAGFAYVRRTPALYVPLLMMAVVGTLSYNFSVVLPLMARVSLGGDTRSIATLMTAMGVGALAGGLWVAARSRPSRRLLVAGTALFGAAAVVAALMPSLAWEAAVLVPMGAFSVLFIATTNSLLQLNSEPSMRGRVMSLWAVVFLGSTPIGSLLVGSIADRFGPRVAFAFGGVAALLTGLVAGWVLWRRLRAAAPEPVERPEHTATCLPSDPEQDEAVGDIEAERHEAGQQGTLRPGLQPR